MCLMKRSCFFLLILLFSATSIAEKPPKIDGRLYYVGRNTASTESVWLSETTAGSFRLEAPGARLVDSWSLPASGLRISVSPVVADGNAGAHELFNNDNNKRLDKHQQRNPIDLPPLPSLPPGVITPPIALPPLPTHPIVIPPTPNVPTHPIVIPPTPGVPTHPIVIPPTPGVPTHPIVIPPTPGVPTHPIVIPPTPGVPTHPIILPGKPTHPIVIPPEPGVPTHPIVIPPEPGVPTHPIVIPPEPVVPTHPIVIPPEPGVPTHPIVIPPEPGVPTHPIVIPPEPGVPTHPITTPPDLPPVAPSNPIGTPVEKPSNGLTPVIPPAKPPMAPPPKKPDSHDDFLQSSSNRPSGMKIQSTNNQYAFLSSTDKSAPVTDALPFDQSNARNTRNSEALARPMTTSSSDSAPVLATTPPESPNNISQGSTNDSVVTSNQSTDESAPITEARQFDENNTWNIWSDNRYYNIKDERFGLNSKGDTTNYTVGADRRFTQNLVSGAMVSHLYYNITGFNGGLENNVSGYNVGPYFGYLINRHWSTDGSLTYGILHNKNNIAGLESSFNGKTMNGTWHATGLYSFKKFQLRPQPLISFSHYWNPNYQFRGNFNNQLLLVDRDREQFNFGFAEFKLEGNYTTDTKNGTVIQPYTEAKVDYVFARPNDGQILTANLTLATPKAAVGGLTAGVRTLFFKSLLIDSSAGYLSIGQSGLNVWQLRLLASYSFS
jgi:hypothetical protein